MFRDKYVLDFLLKKLFYVEDMVIIEIYNLFKSRG